MKLKIQKRAAFLCALILLVLSASACGKDPNVNNKDNGEQSAYNVDVSDNENGEKELPGYHSYGTGKIEPVNVNGVEVDVKSFAVRSYELAYLLGQKNFSSPNELSADVLAQYGFCHVLAPNLNETDSMAMAYRSATPEQVQGKLEELFGTVKTDLTKSELYSPGKKLFEMWMPDYGCNIYYTVDAVNVDGSKAEIITTFYNELARKTMLGRTTLTVNTENGTAVISALKTE